MALSFAVVCESKADKDTACGLADAVLQAKGGLAHNHLASERTWRGDAVTTEFLKWSQIPELLERGREALRGPVPRGFFRGQPGKHDAVAGRRALIILFRLSAVTPDGVLLIRDDDRDSNRREGLEQARTEARDEHGVRAPIVIGLAHVNRECWVLAGFEPRNDTERKKLQGLRQELGFQPHEQPQNLTAKEEHAKKSAKRVLRELTGGDAEREANCWEAADIASLKERGTGTGLSAYLAEVEQRIVPLFERE